MTTGEITISDVSKRFRLDRDRPSSLKEAILRIGRTTDIDDFWVLRNVDLHIERLFMGWALEYEGLKHVSGAPLGSSHLVQFTLIPILRIGVDLGPTIQSLGT